MNHTVYKMIAPQLPEDIISIKNIIRKRFGLTVVERNCGSNFLEISGNCQALKDLRQYNDQLGRMLQGTVDKDERYLFLKFKQIKEDFISFVNSNCNNKSGNG